MSIQNAFTSIYATAPVAKAKGDLPPFVRWSEAKGIDLTFTGIRLMEKTRFGPQWFLDVTIDGKLVTLAISQNANRVLEAQCLALQEDKTAVGAVLQVADGDAVCPVKHLAIIAPKTGGKGSK